MLPEQPCKLQANLVDLAAFLSAVFERLPSTLRTVGGARLVPFLSFAGLNLDVWLCHSSHIY
jgi:hypothetical protein